MAEERSESRSFRIISLIFASLTIALGLLTFIGWILGVPLLASVRAKYIPMAPSTAFCFALIGVGLIAHLLKAALRWIPRVVASVVLAVACAKLVEIFGDLNFGIDPWFVRNPELFGAVPTGRMAPMTAINFLFIGFGLLALTGRQPAKFAGPLGAFAAVIGAVVLVGYWYGTPLLYGGHTIPVALSTACGFFLSGIGIVMAAGATGWPLRTFLGDSTGALLLRAFVPLITAAALINGWINARLPARIHVNPAVSSALCAVVFAALIALIISQISHVVGGRIDRAEAARNLAQAELLALNAHLETKVQERTRELRLKNQQMEEELQMARELQIALWPSFSNKRTQPCSRLVFMSWLMSNARSCVSLMRGHPSALHIQHGNGAAHKLQGNGRPGPAIGIFPTASYVTSSSPMKKGDRVMLFTDGLFEVEDASGTLFTEDQLHTTVTRYAGLPAQEFFDRVISDVRQFSERKSFDDDVCVVGMEVQHTG